MNEKLIKETSKFLSYILRHQPRAINLQLDNEGWADIDELLSKATPKFPHLNKPFLDLVIKTNDKQRFCYNEDKTKIRASQGHSIDIDLALQIQEPPAYLYHGTVEKFIDQIKTNGLQKMSRQHVHLSRDTETAVMVGKRRGNPIVLKIDSGRMHKEGFRFYLSANNVWLTDAVPVSFIDFETRNTLSK